ncbi:MAG TPA: hypothetical protein ENN81_05280 [Phycisphaerales bacterium]|nr:hypothetical protein [Phycisphaerales bacterium]
MIDFSHDGNDWAVPPGQCAVSPMGDERVLMAYADSTHGDPLNWSRYHVPDEYYGSDGVPHVRIGSRIELAAMVGDFSLDCRVDAWDLRVLAEAWLSRADHAAWNPACDIGPAPDGTVNHLDFAVFAAQWLATAD